MGTNALLIERFRNKRSTGVERFIVAILGRKMAIREDMVQVLRGAGLTVRQSTRCMDILIDWMGESLAAGESIELRGFGVFEVKQVSEKKYPSLWSGQSVIPRHGKIVFRPCRKLRQAVWGRAK